MILEKMVSYGKYRHNYLIYCHNYHNSQITFDSFDSYLLIHYHTPKGVIVIVTWSKLLQINNLQFVKTIITKNSYDSKFITH